MTLKGGTTTACAACKYQRRRCTSDCPLAPYFPPDQPEVFQNAHKLFGVKNILKILKQLDPNQKIEAMRSIICQANIRHRYPVYGCWGMIRQLEYQILQAQEALQAVHAQLVFYRQHQQHDISPTLHDSMSHLQLGMGPSNNALTLPNHDKNVSTALPIASAGYYSSYIESKDNNVVSALWGGDINSNNSTNQMAILSDQPLITSQPSIAHQQVAPDYDDIQPFFDTIDDRQSYIDSKEAYESSSESSLKDMTQSIEHVAENKLKSAAACFSLTSVN